MIIRKYTNSDEPAWLACRVVSFLDCSYWNDVKTSKEKYCKPSISLVAEDGNTIVGLIDIELNSDDLIYSDKERGAILWHMAVLPEYRRYGVAKSLWEHAKAELIQNGIRYCELWTQDDIAANSFYRKMGFVLDEAQTWIRCYVQGKKCKELLNQSLTDVIYGPEELIFDAPLSKKEELAKMCYRINEVRLYSQTL